MRLSRTCALMVAVLAVAACDSGGTATPATLPTTSAAPATSTPATTATTAATTSTVMADTTTVPATTVPGTIGLSEGGPWTLVDSAPGITTPGLVYELMPKLWVYLPIQEDIANGITWTFNEEDRPIIEAYLQARLVFYSAISSRPMDFTSSGWTDWYVDGGDRLRAVFEPKGDAGQVADMTEGVVLRPQVAGDNRTDTTALILDCNLDGAVIRNADGSVAEGSTPGVIVSGVAATMRLVAGSWKLERISGEVDGVCG